MVVVVVVPVLISLIAQVSGLEHCSKCGNMEVPYPLSTSDDCGDPKYRVYCNSGVLEFLSAEKSYYTILSINPSTSKLIISPPKVKGGSCYSSDLMVGGLRLDESSPFNISTHNTVFLLNCSNNVLLSPMNCSSNSLCRQFEEKIEEGWGCMNTLCCSFLKDASITSHRIRVRVGGCTAYTSVVDMKSEDSTTWNYGIELQWVPPS